MNKEIKLIKEYMTDFSYSEYYKPNGRKEEYKKIWYLKCNCRLEFYRRLRGDLVSLTYKDTELISWVDQSYQYNNLLGINDFICKISLETLGEILS